MEIIINKQPATNNKKKKQSETNSQNFVAMPGEVKTEGKERMREPEINLNVFIWLYWKDKTTELTKENEEWSSKIASIYLDGKETLIQLSKQ